MAITKYVMFGLLLLGVAVTASAHPMVEDALDIVIEPGRIVIDARISPEQILIAELKGARLQSADQWPGLVRAHAGYLRDHLRLSVDGVRVRPVSSTASAENSETPTASSLLSYRLEYPLQRAPRAVQIEQDFLQELQWTATCVIRIRQSTKSAFETDMLPANEAARFECDWPVAAGRPASACRVDQPVNTIVHIGPTIRAYTMHGVKHILTGYDHLLFVSALVLAAAGIWDLLKVVTAFTLAHTLTLTLSVFGVVTLGERVVESMIAGSIVFVAAQNVFWPEHSRGWSRLGIAFGFGLFHGLGFAGGLRDAMADMPDAALWAALGAFSLGVELGHQIVVIPLYGSLRAVKQWSATHPALSLTTRLRQACSVAIGLAGVYFLVVAMR